MLFPFMPPIKQIRCPVLKPNYEMPKRRQAGEVIKETDQCHTAALRVASDSFTCVFENSASAG